VDPDDPQQLRDTINNLIDNPDRRRQLSALAWQRSQSYFADQMACEYLNAYEALANHAAYSTHHSVTSYQDCMYEIQPVLSFVSVRLEPRQRTFPARHCE